MLYYIIFTNIFISYGKIVCHKMLMHAIEMGQHSMCCQLDTALLLVVHIPKQFNRFIYVAPSLIYT